MGRTRILILLSISTLVLAAATAGLTPTPAHAAPNSSFVKIENFYATRTATTEQFYEKIHIHSDGKLRRFTRYELRVKTTIVKVSGTYTPPEVRDTREFRVVTDGKGRLDLRRSRGYTGRREPPGTRYSVSKRVEVYEVTTTEIRWVTAWSAIGIYRSS